MLLFDALRCQHARPLVLIRNTTTNRIPSLFLALSKAQHDHECCECESHEKSLCYSNCCAVAVADRDDAFGYAFSLGASRISRLRACRIARAAVSIPIARRGAQRRGIDRAARPGEEAGMHRRQCIAACGATCQYRAPWRDRTPRRCRHLERAL